MGSPNPSRWRRYYGLDNVFMEDQSNNATTIPDVCTVREHRCRRASGRHFQVDFQVTSWHINPIDRLWSRLENQISAATLPRAMCIVLLYLPVVEKVRKFNYIKMSILPHNCIINDNHICYLKLLWNDCSRIISKLITKMNSWTRYYVSLCASVYFV